MNEFTKLLDSKGRSGYTIIQLRNVIKCVNELDNINIDMSGNKEDLVNRILDYMNYFSELKGLPYTNWIIHHKLLVGTYPRKEDIKRMEKLGIKSYISLLEKKEIKNYYEDMLGISYINYEIPDKKVISNIKALKIAKAIKQRLDLGEKIYLHCRGGKGRTGTIAAIILMLYGNTLKITLDVLKNSIKSRRIQGKYAKMPQTSAQHKQLKYLEKHIFGDKDTILFYKKKDDYYEFSNYYISKIQWDGKTYPSSEHLFQALKFINDNKDNRSMEYANIIRQQSTPNKSRILAIQKTGGGYKWRTDLNPLIVKYQDVKIRSDWDKVKDKVMEEVLMSKFSQNEQLKNLLLNTGDKLIVENSPRDYYWGIGKHENGKNVLGKLLMKTRTILRTCNI
jgi:ribA/ribD-fused uncharacterized protein